MNTVPLNNSPTTPPHADNYAYAKDLLGAAISALSSRINATTDPDARATLIQHERAERRRQRLLPLDDAATIEQILTEYPAKIQAIRAGDAL